MNMDNFKRVMILCCIGLLCLAPALSSTPLRKPKPANIARLRQIFVQTFGPDFELLGDQIKEEAGEKYWLATVRAKRSGSFSFRYKFQRVNYGYKYADHEYRVAVGEKGCKRRLFYGFHPDMCVGDAVVLHIQISDYIINHSFRKVSRFPTIYSSPYTGMEDIIVEEIDNPLAAQLKLLGRTVHDSVKRDLRTVRVDYRAVFEAKDSGKFNLQLSASVPEALRKFNRRQSVEESAIPIVIVAEKDPIVTVAAEEHIWESDDAPDDSDNPQSSSSGSRNHQYGVLTLRPGDKISLTYCRMELPATKEMEGLANQVRPKIEKLRFDADRQP